MAIEIHTVERTVGGVLKSMRFTPYTKVDGVSPLAEYVVVGNSEYATLITGTTADLRTRLQVSTAQQLEALRAAVYVTDEDSPELTELLTEFHLSAIIGSQFSGATLQAILGGLIDRDQAAADRFVSSGMKILTQVARRGGISAVTVELARQIDGWAVLLDPQGQIISSAGAGRLHIGDAAAVALGRPVRVRHPGLQTHQVGSDSDLAGYLVISSRANWMRHTRDLAQQAAGLCDLLLRSHNPSLTEGLGREVLMKQLIRGGPEALQLLRRWGVHEANLTGFALTARTRSIDSERILARWFDELGAERVYAESHGVILGFVRPDLADLLRQRVAAENPYTENGLYLGLGEPADITDLKRTSQHAQEALQSSLETGSRCTVYAELPTVQRVLRQIGPGVVLHLESMLDALRDETGSHGELTETLRVFLSENGGLRASALRLGIHRQTLSSRLIRIETLTGLHFEHADDRAAAWLALRALQHTGDILSLPTRKK